MPFFAQIGFKTGEEGVILDGSYRAMINVSALVIARR